MAPRWQGATLIATPRYGLGRTQNLGWLDSIGFPETVCSRSINEHIPRITVMGNDLPADPDVWMAVNTSTQP
ncbi:hypothetical protein SAMN05192544_10678 [Paraburkholderia hospita]|nr:hypothetical protein SAMN05192544_10678 [Paraburkholderia hospita]